MIVDTTFVIDLLRGDRSARDLLASLEKGSAALRVPTPVLAELTEAWALSRAPAHDFDRALEILRAQPVVAPAAAHAQRAGRVLADASRRGEPMEVFDAQIAAVALVEDEALVTRDVRAFAGVEGLRLVTY